MYPFEDDIGHSSIQPWSAGEVFPAVITRVEHYPEGESAETCAPSVSWELAICAYRERYASYDDALSVARYVCQNGRVNEDHYAELMRVTGKAKAAHNVVARVMRALLGLPK